MVNPLDASRDRVHSTLGLRWTRTELDQNLARARQLIEQSLESRSDPLPLQDAAALLHEVRGSANLIQCFGVALLAEEMKQTVHDLLGQRVRETDAAYSAVLGATVQVSDYLDLLARGNQDCALVLQPLINELRLTRGKNLMTESDLFLAQFNVLGLRLPPADLRQVMPFGAQREAERFEPVYQAALGCWLRGDDGQKNLGRLGKIAERIAALCSEPALHQLWRTVAACVEGLLSRTMAESLELKRLFARSGQQIRTLADAGETAAARQATDLPARLLFFVGRSLGRGPRVSLLRKQLQLNVYLPSQDMVQQLRASLRGPSTQLLRQVADEIRNDLGEVKESVDAALRSGGRLQTDTGFISERLKRIADTLGLLGLEPEQRALLDQLEALWSVPATETVGEQRLMEFATGLLGVELSLDEALYRQLPPRSVSATSRPTAPPAADREAGVQAVVRESLVNLARLKTYVDTYIHSDDASGLPEAARLMDEIAAGFRVVGAERADQLTTQLQSYLQSPAFRRTRSADGSAERFADAVAALEYLLEAQRDSAQDGGRILNDLAGYVSRLDFAEAAESAAAEASEPALDLRVLREFVEDSEPSALAAAEAGAVAQAGDAVDPEIREVFLSEAEDVLAAMQRDLPHWVRDVGDQERLLEIRRAFHTLKGSGRMVGAGMVGEFSWALESLLNRCLDGAITLSPAIVETVQDAVALLPTLLSDFRAARQGNHEAADQIAERARQLSEGRGETEQPGLVGVFRADAEDRLGWLRRWISAQNRNAEEVAVDEGAPRAFHTLRGAALAVGAQAIGELAGTIEHYLRGLARSEQHLPQIGLIAIDEAVGTLLKWVTQLGQPGMPPPDAEPWLALFEQLGGGPQKDEARDAERELVEIFAGEALELVQKFDEGLQAWSHQPDARFHALTLKTLMHTLKGAAAVSACTPIAAVAQALNLRMENFAVGPVPRPAFFAALLEITEALYGLIDQYREGQLSGEGEQWVARVAALDPLAGPVEPAALSDSDLRQIFVAEAEELYEESRRRMLELQSELVPADALPALKRTLHTLKGSARMAGFPAIGDVAQRMETLTHALDNGSTDALRFHAQLEAGTRGLRNLIDDARGGHMPDASAVLQDIESAAPQPIAAFDLETELIEIPPVAEVHVEAPEPVPMPMPAEPAPVAGFDHELAAVFAPEAAELLEALEAEFETWRQDPLDRKAAGEMLRVLHTLKGGARMAGLNRMGSAAHEMETRIGEIEQAGRAADESTFERLGQDLESLLQMHDRLERGELESLILGPEVPADEEPRMPLVEPAAVDWDPALLWRPQAETEGAAAIRRESARVGVERLDGMLNQAGEISILRSRLEENHATLLGALREMEQTVSRVREQLRLLDIETEAQIAARGFARGSDEHRYESQFDPLEMDRYSRMQELSRALAESANDLVSLHGSLDGASTEEEALLQQQGRVNTELQQQLMGTLMVPFSRQIQRLSRLVRQTAQENGKQARTEFSGVESELDRKVLERMTAPLEHLLRNAVVHGIEAPELRRASGKPDEGEVYIDLKREGSQLRIEVRDDGRGLDYGAIRSQALARGLMRADTQLADGELARFIFAPGFSTASQLTEDAGRGVGMDVVASEVRQLGGTIEVASETGRGVRFTIRLPLMLAVSQALLVNVGEELFALPLSAVEGIVRIPRESIADYYGSGAKLLRYGEHQYRVRYLGELIGRPVQDKIESRTVSAILVRLGDGSGEERGVAVSVDQMLGNREIVSKAVGPVLTSVAGISGATILADGRVVVILDVAALVQEHQRRALIAQPQAEAVAADQRELVMVVDDSITMRRVAERLLTRNGYRVVTAKDGLDAMAMLQTESPAAVLLDIEMPRADGFEVAAFIRNTVRIAQLPIIMITSRSGDKHRENARRLGVNRYLIKPYQEDQLLRELKVLIEEPTAESTGT
jgi:chemosensory pili system protein ChpA (sensor histidine kinase/response regulator)